MTSSLRMVIHQVSSRTASTVGKIGHFCSFPSVLRLFRTVVQDIKAVNESCCYLECFSMTLLVLWHCHRSGRVQNSSVVRLRRIRIASSSKMWLRNVNAKKPPLYHHKYFRQDYLKGRGRKLRTRRRRLLQAQAAGHVSSVMSTSFWSCWRIMVLGVVAYRYTGRTHQVYLCLPYETIRQL